MPYILQNLLLWVQPGQQNLLLVTPYIQYSFVLTNILKGYRQTQENPEHAHLKQLVLSWLHIFHIEQKQCSRWRPGICTSGHEGGDQCNGISHNARFRQTRKQRRPQRTVESCTKGVNLHPQKGKWALQKFQTGSMQIIWHRSLVTRPQGKDELLSLKCTKYSSRLEGF